MSNLRWHTKLALGILNIVEGERLKNAYVTSYIALRSFEEIIDAYSAIEGLHLHDQSSITAWNDRVEWMQTYRKDLLYDWNLLVKLYSSISVGHDTDNEDSVSMMMKIVNRHIKKLIKYYDL